MPRGDRTGPMGTGPMTGRGFGYCSGSSAPGPGRGFGSGVGRGLGGGRRGRRNMFFATGLPGWMRFGPFAAEIPTPDPETEKRALKNQADALQAHLDWIRKRLDEMESVPSGK